MFIMRFYSIVKSNQNTIINNWANKSILLSDIISYPTVDVHYTAVFKNQQELIHLDMDAILQNINCLDMTIGEFADFICKDEYIETYRCNNALHPNLNKCLYGFSLGDVVDKADIQFYDPNNMQYTKNFAIESATDLAISIEDKKNDKLIPVFDENIMFNDGNATHVIIKDMRNTIINDYNQMLPIDKFYFLDLQTFGSSVKLVKLSGIEHSIENNTLIAPNIHEQLNEAKSCIVVLNKKLVPWKLVRMNKDTIYVNLNRLLMLDAFSKYTADELVSSYHSFLILFKDNFFVHMLNGISDIATNSGDIYSTLGIPLNSIHLLNTENYGLSFFVSLDVMLKDVNAQILFDEVYSNPFKAAENFRSHYSSKISRIYLITNHMFHQKDTLVPLYESPEIYKTKSVNFNSPDDSTKRLIPFRIIFSH